MNKNQLLLNVVSDLRSLADSVQALCKETEQKEKTISTKNDKDLKVEQKSEITLETVRGVLAEKSQEGKTDKVRELISKYGAIKLSEISSDNYADILKDAEVM